MRRILSSEEVTTHWKLLPLVYDIYAMRNQFQHIQSSEQWHDGSKLAISMEKNDQPRIIMLWANISC